MTTNEVILKAGGEGGSIALYGLRRPTSWLFSLDLIDPTAIPDDALPEIDRKVVGSWPAAVLLLDRHQWRALSPSLVHPEFRAAILKEVLVRRAAEAGHEGRYQRGWEALCTAPSTGDLASYMAESAVHSSDNWLYDDEPADTPEMREEAKKALMKLGLSEDEAKKLSGG